MKPHLSWTEPVALVLPLAPSRLAPQQMHHLLRAVPSEPQPEAASAAGQWEAWRALEARQRDWARAMAAGQSCEALGLALGWPAHRARAERAAIFQSLHVDTALALRQLLASMGALS